MTDRKTTLLDFFKSLASFDWFYSFSDDHRTWANGEKRFETLRKEAFTDPVKLAMWDRWVQYVNHQITGIQAQRPEPSDFGLA